MTGGESQWIISMLTACLNWVYHLSCTAGGHLKEMEMDRILLIQHILLAVCMEEYEAKRGISLVVILCDGDLFTPCINKSLWIRRTDQYCYKIPYDPFLDLD